MFGFPRSDLSTGGGPVDKSDQSCRKQRSMANTEVGNSCMKFLYEVLVRKLTVVDFILVCGASNKG